jgi:transcriptional regulator with XRE-family HTH domain/Zn-dependent peptidase ImmA (M78 family)
MTQHTRKSHFLGTKLRALRKRNGLTLEELSARCIQRDSHRAPSVSYLSMIESGKRVPSEDVLSLLSRVFQREPRWFLDGNPEVEPAGFTQRAGGAAGVPLEPAFLFSKDLLQAAIPELLAQTGTSGRQFAHLLIRSHQEMSRNDFPDLERSAESIGERRFPLSTDDLMRLCRHHGLGVRWFDRKPVLARDKDRELRSMVRSFFESPRTVYLNRELQSDPARLKFDLASHLGHKVLHEGDGLKSAHATGGEMGGSPEGGTAIAAGMSAQDVLHAWRDFECSFFAGALLCPKVPFRRFLTRESYRVEAGEKIDLTPAVVMRRMTKVSPYPYWHFFDAYPPGYLRAVYRGNGIPLPWGNMAQVSDPCPNWAVFRMLNESRGADRGSQISVLRDGEQSLLYCCHSRRTNDMAGNPHVLSVGIDLVPALRSHGVDAEKMVASIAEECLHHRGEAKIPRAAAEAIREAARVLNIAWVEDALATPARIICPRSMHCPRTGHCDGASASRAREITDVRKEIVTQARRGR